jgi:hypothetical protein
VQKGGAQFGQNFPDVVLRDEHRLMVFENRVLREYLDPIEMK